MERDSLNFTDWERQQFLLSRAPFWTDVIEIIKLKYKRSSVGEHEKEPSGMEGSLQNKARMMI